VGCTRSKPQGQKLVAMQPIELPDKQFVHVHLDLVSPCQFLSQGAHICSPL
jgi:hypothetical protein